MKIVSGDSVVRADGDVRDVGIVERRSGSYLRVRFPGRNNEREQLLRSGVRAVAEVMYDVRHRGTKFRNDLSLTGGSTLAELVAAFGYSTQGRLRQDSLEKVCRQLNRAGLEVIPGSDRWARGDTFVLVPMEGTAQPPTADIEEESRPRRASLASPQSVALPDPFWPTRLGLDSNLELTFLRALTGKEPLLCLLHVPDDTQMRAWLQPTWEGLMTWAYCCAQEFERSSAGESREVQVRLGTPPLLHSYLAPTALDDYARALCESPHSMNLVALKRESDLPVDFERLRAIWPVLLFQFKPHPPISLGDANVSALVSLLLLVAGDHSALSQSLCPLRTLLWSKECCAQLLTQASLGVGRLFAETVPEKFRGSNEGAKALALKARLLAWISSVEGAGRVSFEECEEDEQDGLEYEGWHRHVQRVDMLVESLGRFEVETMLSSGPIEWFYHRKVFSRIQPVAKPLWLVLPNDSLLWAGPYMADLAHYLGKRGGHVLVPAANNEGFVEIEGKALEPEQVDVEVQFDQLVHSVGFGKRETPLPEAAIRLSDVAGYGNVRDLIVKDIIWPEKHRRFLVPSSRSSGILFFGPPGCGKSRLARAIAGELEQEVRLLYPSDLRGPYIGWGQIMIREQFNWLADSEQRMLIIDEIDATARSRREHGGGMHSDEKANVNELLTQLDRVLRLGRLVAGTTNFIESLDDAVLRSGRFGRFIPVPPPDVDEAAAILNYYLQQLRTCGTAEGRTGMNIPDPCSIKPLLEPLFLENIEEDRFFCGADLEEAVDRAYKRCVRKAMEGHRPEDYPRVLVSLSLEELAQSLGEVPRSVTKAAFERFLSESDQYCGRKTASEFAHHAGVTTPRY